MSVETPAPAPSSGRRLLSATAVMASGTLVSRILGFVRVMLIAFVLGNGTRQADIFSVAMTVPNSLFMLFAGGALNTVLVPQIVRAVKNDSDGGEAYVSRIMTAFLLALAGIAAIVTLATPVIIGIYTSARWRVPELAAHYDSLLLLAYLTMPQLFFYGAFFLVGQVLNARDKFGPMMWAPLVNNVVSIGVFILYLAVWGNGGDRGAAFDLNQVLVLGVGSTLGIIAQTLVLIPYLRRAGFRYRPRFDLRGVGLGHTFHIAKWTLAYVGVNQLALIVVDNLATSATAGGHGAGVTVYLNAYLVWILPHSLITVSLATAMLPQASRLAAEQDFRAVGQETTQTLRLASTFLLPAAFAFLVLAQPFALVAFGHGRGVEDAGFVAWTLMAFAIGLIPFTLQYVCLRGFYALEDTKTTFLIQVVIAAVNAALALAFVLPWHDPTTVAPRLALAFSLAYTLGAYLSFRSLQKRLPGMSLGGIVQHLVRLALAALPGALLAWGLSALIGRFTQSVPALLGTLLAGGAVMLLTFLFTARRLHIAEVHQMIGFLRRRRGIARESDVPPEEPKIAESAEAQVVEELEQQYDPAPDVPPPPPGMIHANQPLLHYPDPSDGHEPTVEITQTEGIPVARVKAGQLLGNRYRLEEVLAQRDSTLTWRAFDTTLSRAVLMHILPPHDPRAEEILTAARAAAVATDSRFLRVLDAYHADDESVGSYIVCEYAPGESLEHLLEQGPLSPLEAAWLVRELADALAGVHAQGLYHRQLNPDTVIVTAAGNVKVVGFLIEASLYPELDASATAGEAADVTALGQLLYASMVSAWPGGQRYGLRPAPRDGKRFRTPRQVQPGVSPSLDRICDQILNDPPRSKEPRLTTAQAVMIALTKVLGNADASHDLERRMKYPVALIRPNVDRPAHSPRSQVTPVRVQSDTQFTPDETPTVSPSTARLERPVDIDQATAEMVFSPFEDTGPFTPVPPPPRRGTTSPMSARQTAVSAPVGDPVGRPTTAAEVPDGETPAQPAERPQPSRRWLVWLLAVAAAVLTLSLIAVAIVQIGGRLGGSAQASPTPSATAPTPSAYPIKAAKDFDPAADGGSNDESTASVRLAIDGNPKTLWRTEIYYGSPKLGGIKPGVGLVIDLGQAVSVGSVKVTLAGTGTDVTARVPISAANDSPPMNSERQWRTIASVTGASGTVTLTPKASETTRYLLVYLTSLPKDGSGYRGGIYEVEVDR